MAARVGMALGMVLFVSSGCERPPEILGARAMFRGDAAHSGVYEGGDFSGFGGVRWAVRTGGAVRGSPTVDSNRVYVASTDGMLRALDVESGVAAWVHDLGSPTSSTPAVAGPYVFVGDRAGVLHAVRTDDGGEAWRLATGPDMALPWGSEGWDYYTSSPAVAEGVVLMGRRRRSLCRPRGHWRPALDVPH